jgi:hypothetical protein
VEPEEIKKATLLLQKSQQLPVRRGYKYFEPSELKSIKKCRPNTGKQYTKYKLPGQKAMKDKVLGAWLGRCAGCLLGKPVEGVKSSNLWHYLEATGQAPLKGYIKPATEKVASKYNMKHSRLMVPFTARCMPVDDDTNYTVTGFGILKTYGSQFTPENVGKYWLSNIPFLSTCTAERVAYRNMACGIKPPESAVYLNPYREWIGAQIRADFWGYASVGNPELAAEFAWRDACISHIKNGIYGEMWVSAMLAVAPFLDEPSEVIKAGLQQIPARSRLAEAINRLLDLHKTNMKYTEVMADIHKRWDEYNPHHWCHTISNAEIVASALLWGELDFTKSICYAVEACFDTDCNGATVGSIVGMMIGAQNIPSKWTKPLNDTLLTTLIPYPRVSISKLAEETLSIQRTISS